ncbi:hypothetical protein PIB30_087610 [Stylosanthes scabra]|uniref:Uncharacterized protein n=1 Tax=Stylosanthes scabra TaxID=79078 RepID=A0ABU6RTT3_9FABA|nr:hypothetical protein [Stylosanthes scabra]
MRESWWRIDRRAGSNQFFRRSRQLPVAITFDPELRWTHGLRLREALVVLFAIITHAKRGWKLRDEMRPVGRDDEMNGIGMDVFEEGIEDEFDG